MKIAGPNNFAKNSRLHVPWKGYEDTLASQQRSCISSGSCSAVFQRQESEPGVTPDFVYHRLAPLSILC